MDTYHLGRCAYSTGGTDSLEAMVAAAKTKAEGGNRLAELVARFAANEMHYKSAAYDEASIRNSFINPFFEALGWDVLDEQGLGPGREVLVESRVSIAGNVAGDEAWDDDLTIEEMAARDPITTIPDYTFRLGDSLQFLAEAKRPSVNLRWKVPTFQLKSYAWSLRLPVGVLTNFYEFRVFDTSLRPQYERPAEGIMPGLDLRYSDYLDAWDLLWDTLSRASAAAGNLVGRAQTAHRRARGAVEVDEAFLRELEDWRHTLADDIARHNHDLDRWALAEATQRILDRVVFLRVCEDRQIEPGIVLRRYARLTDSYRQLVAEFRRLDAVYNGQLFRQHFSERLAVDDAPLQRLVQSLYFPYSPYRFDVISPDLLGAIYERFLGREITIDDNGVVWVEDKPEVRHAGGVYYTPRWVVDHIVQQTLVPLLDGKTPRTAANVRILDPACGSGAFLLGAFDYLIRWHERYYDAHPDENRQGHFTAMDGQRRLTSDLKGRILTNSIYGVDIDPQAVEVTQMSLYLKLLEHENRGTLTAQHRLFHTGFLPPLDANIRSGNSLLAPADVDRQVLFGDLDLRRRVNSFDWHDDAHGFGQVFRDRGGFDVIIGNPPYTRTQVLRRFRPEETAAYAAKYASASEGSFDIAGLFIERGLQLLRPARHGSSRLGFIISRQFTEADYGRPLRQLLAAGAHLEQIVDFRDGLVFQDIGAYTLILIANAAPRRTFSLTRVVARPSRHALTAALTDGDFSARKPANTLADNMWDLLLPGEELLLTRLEETHPSLLGVAREVIFQGVVTGADYVFRLTDHGPADTQPGCRLASRRDDHSSPRPIEEALLRPVYAGRSDIRRFATSPSTEVLVLPYCRAHSADRYELIQPGVLQADYPHAWAWLVAHKAELRDRAGQWGNQNWYAYSRRQNLELFEDDKVLVPYMVYDLCAHFDTQGHFFVNVATGGYGIPAANLDDPRYLSALLSSRLLSWVLARRSRAWRGGWFAARKGNLARLPIPAANAASRQHVVELHAQCGSAKTQVALVRSDRDKELAQRQLIAAIREFDATVEDLYALDRSERRLVAIR